MFLDSEEVMSSGFRRGDERRYRSNCDLMLLNECGWLARVHEIGVSARENKNKVANPIFQF